MIQIPPGRTVERVTVDGKLYNQYRVVERDSTKFLLFDLAVHRRREVPVCFGLSCS
jgi:hypothetical protein